MPVETNAKTANQQKLVTAFTERFNDPDAEVTFDGLKVSVADKQTGELETFGNYAAFKNHIEHAETTQADDDFDDVDFDEIDEDDFDFEDDGRTYSEDDAAEKAQATPTPTPDPEPDVDFDVDDDDIEAAAAAIEAAMADDEGDPDPEPEPAPEAKAEQAKAETQQRESKSESERKTKADDELDKLISDMAETVVQERRGEIAKNQARWQKGEQVARVDDIAARYKQAGNEELSSRQKLLDFTTNAVETTVRAQGIIEGISRLNPTELAFTKKAYVTFAEKHGGPDGTFKLLDQLDEQGNPLEDEHGNPYIKQIGEIALNKAYHLSEFATDDNRDRLLSFGWAYSEATCRGLHNLLKEKNAQQYPERVDDVLDGFYENQVTVEDDNGYTSKINMPDKDARDYLKDRGAKVDTQVKSIKIDANLYDGMWRDVVTDASVIWRWLGNETHSESGMMRNTVLLERLLAFFDPNQYGFSNLVQMLVESGDMTSDQATKFLEEHQDYDRNQEG